MHEVSLVEDLIKSIRNKIEEGMRVEKVFLKLGDTTHLSRESLKFWFENLSKGTPLEGAELCITPIEGEGIIVEAVEVI